MRYRFRRSFASFFHGMDIARRVILGTLFWGLVILILVSLLAGRSTPVPNGSILVLHPHGSIVDSYTSPATYQGIPVSGYYNETLLSDLVKSLEIAAEDRRIQGAWLYLNDLDSAGPAAAGELADALRAFRESGKTIVATADTFDTARYRIASPANTIVVDRLGEVFPAGYGSWRAYYAEGLEKLGAEARLFRSGESKTGAENYILDGMSEAALRNEQRLLGDLWSSWLEAVADDRNLSRDELDDWIQNYDVAMIEAGGDGSLAALERGLVDEIETGGVVEHVLDNVFHLSSFPVNNPEGIRLNRIDSFDYLRKEKGRRRRGASLAIIPVSGALVYGEGGSNSAGSVDIVAAIEAARAIPGVEALVLRINSPGGDVRAGEAIRRSLEETRRDWNIPIVASMGNLAASGGYWIALESDLIVTRPETITGSIGVYSLSLSFEQALARWLGVRIDGWGTTPWSDSGNPGRTMDERTASLYEASVKDIDEMFRGLVSEKRGMDPQRVSSLAGGIPWSGKQAVENGLADREGSLNDAIDAAAELAGQTDLQVLYFEDYQNPREQLLSRFLWGPSARTGGVLNLRNYRSYRR